MKSCIAILAIVMMAIVGMAGAEDYIAGEGKGPDAIPAMRIGLNEPEQINATAAMLTGGVIELSGTSPDIFDTPRFANSEGWASDPSFAGMTASQAAFLKDNAADGAPRVTSPKTATLGLIWKEQAMQPADPVFDDGVMV